MSASLVFSNQALFLRRIAYLLKQIEISSMKEMYIKPEVRVMKFEPEGVLCGSSNGNPGGTTPDFEWDDSWPANSIW